MRLLKARLKGAVLRHPAGCGNFLELFSILMRYTSGNESQLERVV
jgi:hypothetical protein